MPTFNLQQLVNKELFAKGTLNARAGASVESKLLYTFKPGALVGTVYSAVNTESGPWLMIDRNVSGVNVTFFVKATAAGIDLGNLREQGAKTVVEQKKAEEEAAKTTGEKFLDLAKKVGIVLGTAYTVFQVVKLVRNKKSAQ